MSETAIQLSEFNQQNKLQYIALTSWASCWLGLNSTKNKDRLSGCWKSLHP